MYHRRVKRHERLQLTLAAVSGVVAYYLWTSQPVAPPPSGVMLGLQEMADAVGDWVRHLRRSVQ